MLLLSVFGTACATGSQDRGRVAELSEDYDGAVIEYTRAARERPTDRGVKRDLERAKLRAAQYHYALGRRQAGEGNYEDAVVEYQIAFEMNPNSGDIQAALRDAQRAARTRIAAREDGQTELETLIERASGLPPEGFELPEATLPDSLVFRDASTRDVFSALGQFADVSVIFDPTFIDEPVSIDLRGASLSNALTSVARSTRNFFRITGEQTVTVIPDTPAKRREYEEEVVQTFYLSNADLKETMDLLRLVLDARRISPTTATNALTIKDTPERIAAAGRVLSAIDKARPELIIDIELLEVDRTKLQEYGLQLASPGSPGIEGSATIAGASQTLTLQSLRNLSQSDLLFASLPGLYYRLLKTDANTRTLANPQLRTSEGIPAQAKFGERVPVPVTTFAPIATGGTPQQPMTSFQYENIGVNIDITPRTHHNDDVTLALRVAVSSISGTGFGGLPTFGNREINTVIRLRDGETNMLAGLIRDDERQSLEGIPGLSDLPIVGRLFAHTQKTTQQTDIILTLTPHIIRVLDLSEADLRPFRVGRESVSPLTDLPLPFEIPRPAEAAPAPPAAPSPNQPVTTPGPIQPLPASPR